MSNTFLHVNARGVVANHAGKTRIRYEIAVKRVFTEIENSLLLHTSC